MKLSSNKENINFKSIKRLKYVLSVRPLMDIKEKFSIALLLKATDKIRSCRRGTKRSIFKTIVRFDWYA